jgi:transcriptional repressor NrdR
MRCPFCGHNKDKVIDSRAAEGDAAIRRRRQCVHCGKRFTTYEHIEQPTRLTVVKKDGTRVPFDRQKMLEGLEKACYKRQVSPQQLQEIVDEVEEELLSRHEKEIAAVDIGRELAERLKHVDQVAYVRFASVYKQFRDLDDFLDEVREVIDTSESRARGQGRLF